MIKYARTKDNKIIKINTENDVFTSKYEIIGELADNPEELCDEIVIDCKENINKKPFIHILSPKIYTKRKFYYSKDLTITVYAAIWTEEGLIYKAKMNKERGFELI